jgi:predicted dehydrogenase
MLYHPDGEPEAVDVPAGDGYFCELQHFVECITAGKPSPIVPPQSAYQSVKLIEAEVKSALTGKTVPVKL